MSKEPPSAWEGRAIAEPGCKTWDGPKRISIVGSTGSIGIQTLDKYLTLASTVLAFVWSPHVYVSQAVIYQTISPKDLAKSSLSEGGWPDLLCAGKSSHQPIDVALVFIGKELPSSRVAANSVLKEGLRDLPKASFTSSNLYRL